MENNPQTNLEELIQRELSKLPERQAPQTLIPRVLAQIEARAHKRWWQCPWSYWPSSLKALSLPVMLGSAVGAVFGVSLQWNLFFANSSLAPMTDKLEWLSSVVDVLAALGNSVLVLGRAAGQQWLLLGLLVPVAMYLACVGLGTLCYRMACSNR